ncbi:MAG: hypothetical protein QM765_07880 [Myxococcales bacterium]
MQGLVRAMVEMHSSNPRLHRVLFEEAPHPAEVLRELERIEESIAEVISRLLASHPEVKVPDPDAAAYMVVHVVEGLTHHFVIHPGESMTETVLCQELVAMLEGYLRNPQSGRERAAGPRAI